MKLYERLCVDEKVLNEEATIKFLERWNDPIVDIRNTHTVKALRVSEPNFAAYFYCLLENNTEAKKFAIIAVESAIEFFFGEWRQQVPTRDGSLDPEYWKVNSGWDSEFRGALLWASCLGDWNSATKIAQYPTAECCNKYAIKNPEMNYPLVLAAFIRGDSLESVQSSIDVVEKGVKKKEKLLLAVLMSIVKKDKEMFDEAFLEYMKYFKKKDAKSQLWTERFATEGTILFNLARHKGLEVDSPEKYRDHFICFS
jgi:hypothetical protein